MEQWKQRAIEMIGLIALWLLAKYIEATFGKPDAADIFAIPSIIYFLIRIIIHYKHGDDMKQ